jgi:hypothetical protein
MRPTTLLHAALQNLLARSNRVGEHRAFLERVGHRLFQVHVFAGRHGIGRHAHMPVVRRRDKDGVNVFFEHLVIVHVRRRQPV